MSICVGWGVGSHSATAQVSPPTALSSHILPPLIITHNSSYSHDTLSLQQLPAIPYDVQDVDEGVAVFRISFHSVFVVKCGVPKVVYFKVALMKQG